MDVSAEALLAEVPDLPGHESQRLLLLAARQRKSWLIGNPGVEEQVAVRFRSLVARRRAGEPLQYIEGSVQFGRLELLVDRSALIPRPETERLWELVVAEVIDVPSTVVDLCTGSGNLALACKSVFPEADVFATDLSAEALTLAQVNANRLGLAVEFCQGDLFDALPGHLVGAVDLLVSNPPYVAEAEVDQLPEEVRDYEPRQALVAGEHGTEVLARIAADGAEWLAPRGLIACEIGENQGGDCLELFAAYDPIIKRDLAGRVRYLFGRT